MANFTPDQAVAVASVQQLINEWAYELDVNNGLNIAGLVTEDCAYTVRATLQKGRPAVEKFYKERLAAFKTQGGEVPTQRHILSNLRVQFRSEKEVAINFTLVYFTTAGMSSGLKHADPAAVADVRMECQRGADGDWKISLFDSGQTFQRVPK